MECLLTIALLILKYRTLDRTLLEKYNKFESCMELKLQTMFYIKTYKTIKKNMACSF